MAIQIGFAKESDEQGIRDLLGVPMKGAVSLAMTREPNAFAGNEIDGIRNHIAVVRDENKKVIGLGVRSVREVFIDGVLRKVGYLHQFRTDGDRLTLGKLRKTYKLLGKTRQTDELPYDYTTIAQDNTSARRLLEKGLNGLPKYQPQANLCTMVIATRPFSHVVSDRVYRSSSEDLADIMLCIERNQVQKDFSVIPELGNSAFDHEQEILISKGERGVNGCCTVWCQNSYKQIVIKDYAPLLKAVRAIVNLLLFIRRRPLLPKAPAELDLAYLAFLSVDDNNSERTCGLVREACKTAFASGLEYLVLSLDSRDPLLSIIKKNFRPYCYNSILYLVYWGDVASSQSDKSSNLTGVEAALL